MYFSQRVSHPRECRSGLAVCILVALAPDVDYLAWWIARIQLEPRATHSLLFCLGCALVAWVAMHAFASQGKPAVSLTTLLLASCSHLVLDFFVGVHGLPLFLALRVFRIGFPSWCIAERGTPQLHQLLPVAKLVH